MNTPTPYPQSYTKTITINAPAAAVWKVLTDIELMKQWMAEEEIEILTDWTVGSPMIIKGTAHWVYFENRGEVLAFEPERLLRYSHASSLSKLPEQPESYSVVEFALVAAGDKTELMLTLQNFPTESIYKHLVFYWNTTLEIIKELTERQ